MNNKLDTIFESFDKKKEEEQKQFNQKSIEGKALREESLNILKTIVLPVLNGISAKIKERGHHSKVIENLSTEVVDPSVTLEFTPITKDVYGNENKISPSKLTFQHDESGKIVVITKYNRGKKGHYANGRKVESKKKLTDITKEFVQSEAEKFTKIVLEINQ